MLNMKCLYELNSKKLDKFWVEELRLNKWYIRNDTITARTQAASYLNRFNILKERAEKLGYSFNETEIISWLDTLTTMCGVFNRLNDDYLKNNILILQEYCIPYSNKRADYLLIYDNKILIIEFSFNKLGYEFNYETKLQQAISYKELLGNILPKEIDIGTYTFLLEPEEDKNGKTIYVDNEKEILPNDLKMQALANYIEKFFKKNINLAENSLRRLQS